MLIRLTKLKFNREENCYGLIMKFELFITKKHLLSFIVKSYIS